MMDKNQSSTAAVQAPAPAQGTTNPTPSANVALPAHFSLQGDTVNNWKTFRQRFRIYMLASGADGRPNAEKVALLLTVGGDVLINIYNSFEWENEGDGDVYTTVFDKFDEYFLPRQNFSELMSRYKFNSTVQGEGEALDSFITRLRNIAKDCGFGVQKDKCIRDRIVFGMKDDRLREKCFREDELTLQKAVKLCQAHDATMKSMRSVREENIHQVQSKQSYKYTKKKEDKKKSADDRKPRESKSLLPCKFCGQKHVWGTKNCPAYGKQCQKCKEKNHFAIVCRKTKQRVHLLDEEEDDDEDSENEEQTEFVLKIGSNDKNGKKIMANMEIEDKIVAFQVDSGSTVNVIPRNIAGDDNMLSSDCELKSWSGESVKPIGKKMITVKNCKTEKKYTLEFVVVEGNYTPVIGKIDCEKMKLITVNYENINSMETLNKYSTVFDDGLGKLPGTVHLAVDKDAIPVAIATCRSPVNIKEKIKKKIDEMTEMNVISKVDEPTDWVSRMVTSIKKNGDIRICIDPQALNAALKRELHPLPVIDDILPELSKARIYSKFDLRNGYWQCELDDESSRLTTFQTPFGRYKWNRLPFGLAVSSEIFQKRLMTALEGLDGTICVADDILVFGVGENDGEAEIDHERKLEALLNRCQEIGIKLNGAKTELRKKEVTFLGHKITHLGLQIDPEKVEAVTKMQAPQNVKEVQRFAGMVNYLARFLPQLSEIIEPIRVLTMKDRLFVWGEKQEEAFAQIKLLVTQAPVLAYYDRTKELQIQCDASKSGIGAVLMQEGKPICFASKALTTTEEKYAVIEKEMLAVLFSLKKFHQYTFGNHTTVYSDHKPLQSILRKSLDKAPRRLQGMILATQLYDFQVQYCPGREMHIADLLSRSYLPSDSACDSFDHVNAVDYVPVRSERLSRMRKATSEDPVLQLLIATVLEGWPEEKMQIPPQIASYFQFRDEIVVNDGLVFKGNRIIVPENMRKEIKEALHVAHIGIESTLRRARECVFWPSMHPEIKMMIMQCPICNSQSKSQQKESLMNHDASESMWPFQKVGVDLMTMNNRDFLVMVDYNSNFWEVDELKTTKSSEVIRKLRAHFSRYGAPSVLVSDNGPQFYCEEFSEFMKKWDIEHRTSSPGHPKSNGMVESAVKNAKKIISRALQDGTDPHIAILEYRNTPQADGMSPAQKFLGRRTRGILPTTASLMQPRGIDPEMYKTMRRIKNAKAAAYYDRYSKDLEALEEGECVRIKPMTLGNKVWKKGTVSKRLDERSYEVDTEDGTLRRNRVYLRKTNEANDEQKDKNPIHEDKQNEEPKAQEVPEKAVDNEVKMPALRRSTRATKGVKPLRYQ